MKKSQLKRKIVLDFDDTLVKSSEHVIKILNKRYGLDKTIADLSDWSYRNIYHGITEQELSEMFASKEFWGGILYDDCKIETLKYNVGVLDFLEYAKDKYEVIICSKGTKDNLEQKEIFCIATFNACGIEGKFVGIEIGDVFDATLDKSGIDFSDCLFAVDDNTNALLSLNVPCKFLLKNHHDQYWNKEPINEKNLYVINDFYDLIEFCKFDEMLRQSGVEIGER